MSSQKAYGAEYIALYKRFNITKYNLLPKDKFDEAMKWLHQRLRLTEHRGNHTKNKVNFKNRNSKSICARFRQLAQIYIKKQA
ncbi:MAG: hypothetical protein ACK5H1_04670 [Tenacibaculum sp.]